MTLQHIEFVGSPTIAFCRACFGTESSFQQDQSGLTVPLSREELERTANYLTANLPEGAWPNCAEIMASDDEEKALFDKLLQTAVILCSQVLRMRTTVGRSYVGGTTTVSSISDFADLERLRGTARHDR